MTLEDYDYTMKIFTEGYLDDGLLDKIGEFQLHYMRRFLKEYEQVAQGEPVKEKVAELFEYAVEVSRSGSSVIEVETREKASRVAAMAEKDIGEYLLDPVQVYQNDDGMWSVDAMFGGYYVPYWNGWNE